MRIREACVAAGIVAGAATMLVGPALMTSQASGTGARHVPSTSTTVEAASLHHFAVKSAPARRASMKYRGHAKRANQGTYAKRANQGTHAKRANQGTYAKRAGTGPA